MSEPRGRAWLLALLAIYAAHVGLVVYFFGSSLPLPSEPYSKGDFATHAEQVWRVLEGLRGWGQHWVYDVRLLAGAPNGVLFDADVKGWELWTWALVQLGVDQGKAYNAHVLAIHLAMPLVVYASARLFGLRRSAATLSTALAVLLWSFDSFTHWMWSIGTVTYSFVAYFALLPLALFWRWLERPSWWAALGCAVSLGLGLLEHPYLFFILAWPMLALWLRASLVARTLDWRGQLVVLGIAGFAVAVNAWWLRTALQFMHYILDSAYYEQGGIEFVVWDLLGLLHESSTQGMIGPRVGVRVFALIAALAGLRAWRLAGDARRLPFVVLIASMAALAFLGGYTPFAQIQPYRHNLALGYALLIPAGAWLDQTLRKRPWRSLATEQRVLAGALGLLATLHVIGDALYFFADSMRETQTMEDGAEILMNSLGHTYTPRYGYRHQPDYEGVVAWIEANDDGRSRWLIADQVLGEYVMARTDAQVIGGFVVRNIEHSDANWVRHHGPPPYDAAAFARYLDTYAIGWVLVAKPREPEWWDEHPELLARARLFDEWLVYRVKRRTPLASSGTVSAATNRIDVRGSKPGEDLLLRYHWLETLRCTPDCTIERVPVDGDRVGFMRIPAPHPRDLAVVNGY